MPPASDHGFYNGEGRELDQNGSTKSRSRVQEQQAGASVGNLATLLAIGTAVPPFVHEQSSYPDYYFDITQCNHKTELKAKFKRICEKLQIEKRYMVVRRDLLEEVPSLVSYMDPSLNDRHQVVMEWVPKLAKEAALNAIKKWGRPVSDITHVVMVTTSVVNMPGVDLIVAKSVGLSPKVRRVMLYQTGCWGGAAALRVAKDLAENNKGARVLVICSDCTAIFFRGPNEHYLDGLVGQGLFGDGAAAVIVGAEPVPQLEHDPMFEIQWSGEMLVPDTETALEGHLMEAGMYYHQSREYTKLVCKSVGEMVDDAREQLVAAEENKQLVDSSCNGLFWAIHPGCAAFLNQIENQFALVPQRLAASRDILRNYGNMQSCSVFFVLDQIHHRSLQAGANTTGEGKQYGLLLGTGPGLTIECSLLRSCSIPTSSTHAA
ncbi:unnamed protein product [Sphagnum troendelagicum]|uniref:Chalcone synthase n=1 Tax=Sphagnum troendelagicum TaxID=128251 RepID=A0ABP0THK6_9BRYO